jgi:uncharacterized protein YqjF (DUF2071 family)
VNRDDHARRAPIVRDMPRGVNTQEVAHVVHRPLFRADWREVLFVHLQIEPQILQPAVPFELDLFDGAAYISLVAFAQSRLRPIRGGRIAAMLAAPLAEHHFLNVRTYVRHRDDRGIYFIAEWIPNRLAQFIGPRMYGLPYRLGQLEYQCDARGYTARVQASSRELKLLAAIDEVDELSAAASALLTEFLLERYVAFTSRRGVRRRFDVAHAPWRQVPVKIIHQNLDLLSLAGAWHRSARLHSANYSPGVSDVLISAPQKVD